MQAVLLGEQGARFIPDHASPPPREGEVPVRVLSAGICETDLQLIRGYMGFRGVLGHEFVGVAEAGTHRGRRVVGEINCSCRRCEWCREGLARHCPDRTVLGILAHDGAFAERVCVPEENLHVVPDDVPDDAAVFVEPLAAAFQVPAQLDLSRFGSAVVLGDGRLGNLCAQVLRLSGVDLTVVGKHPEKLAILKRLGIRTSLLADDRETRRADLVVDCTGSASGIPTAVRFVRPRGTIVLKTTVADDAGPPLAPIVIDELTIVGSRCGPFPRAIQALQRREVRVEPLISARFPLSEFERAIAAAHRNPNVKVLLDLSR
jgi:threonine dehydrogenase-like Zn-dependent dehydrogenase